MKDFLIGAAVLGIGECLGVFLFLVITERLQVTRLGMGTRALIEGAQRWIGKRKQQSESLPSESEHSRRL